MGINFEKGHIDSDPVRLSERTYPVSKMSFKSDSYIEEEAVWFDKNTFVYFDKEAICYPRGLVELPESESTVEEWFRLIRLPEGIIIDASHRMDFCDDESGKFLWPIPKSETPKGVTPEQAIGYIATQQELIKLRDIVKAQYNWRLPKNVLESIAEGPVT